MNSHYEEFRGNSESISGLFNWNSQEPVIKEIILSADAKSDHLSQDSEFDA